ncbi:MAG: ABC transporter substrate-binding protein [Bacillota bacterium]
MLPKRTGSNDANTMHRIRSFMMMLVLSAMLMTGSEGAGAAATKIRIGYLHTLAVDSHLWLGIERGVFEKYGLQLELTRFNSGVPLMQALAGGSIDVGIMGAVISNFPSRGVGKVFLLNNLEHGTAVIFVQDESGIYSVRDLNGRKVTTTRGTTADVLLYIALQKAGVKYTDVNVINMDMAAAVSAFIAGASDAVSTWWPFDLYIMKNRPTARKLTQAGDYFPDAAIAGGWVASNRFYERERPTLVKLARAWLEVNELLLNDTDRSLKTIQQAAYPELDYEELLDGFRKEKVFRNEEWAGMYRDGRAAKWIGQVEEVFMRLGAFTDWVPPERFFDPSVYLEAYEAYKSTR